MFNENSFVTKSFGLVESFGKLTQTPGKSAKGTVLNEAKAQGKK